MSRKPILPQLALGAALLLAAGGAVADAPLLALPESPAWRLGRGFITAFNAGDGASLDRFLAEHLGIDAAAQQPAVVRAAVLQRLRREVGPVEVVEASGVSHALVLNARTAAGESVDVVLVVSPDDPARIDALRVVREEPSELALGVGP